MLEVENNAKLLTKDSLGVAELLTLFEYPNAISEIPFRRKGGEIFVFKSSSGKKNDWKADGHTYVAIFSLYSSFHYLKCKNAV